MDDMFKLRYSYGKVGSDKLKIGDTTYRFPYLYTIKDDGNGWTWSDYGSPDNVYTGMQYTQLASNNVTWEIATKHDAGVDLSLFNDKFTATVDYFHDSVMVSIWNVIIYLACGCKYLSKSECGKCAVERF